MGNGQESGGSNDYGQAPYHSSLDITVTSDSYPSTTGWTYVVGRYDCSEVSVWVNGEKQPTTAAVASPFASGNGVTLIGHLGSSVYPFNGVLEVADGESSGAHSAYEGHCASYTEPDPPDLTTPGDPYAGPPTDPPAVPPVADITERFSG